MINCRGLVPESGMPVIAIGVEALLVMHLICTQANWEFDSPRLHQFVLRFGIMELFSILTRKTGVRFA